MKLKKTIGISILGAGIFFSGMIFGHKKEETLQFFEEYAKKTLTVKELSDLVSTFQSQYLSSKLDDSADATSKEKNQFVYEKTQEEKASNTKHEHGKSYQSRQEELFNNLYNLKPDTKFFVYIRKDLNSLQLYKVQNDQLILDFETNTTDGFGQGQKKEEGDRKTPEGVYKIQTISMLSNSSYSNSELYGSAKILIDYPSKNDVQKNRTGCGILLCGTGLEARIQAIDNKKDVTNGSVVLKNQDIASLANKIADYEKNTLIIIEDSARPLNYDDYKVNF